MPYHVFSLLMNDGIAKIVFFELNRKFKLFYSKIAAIPGNVFPSRLSNIAPPPVLT